MMNHRFIYGASGFVQLFIFIILPCTVFDSFSQKVTSNSKSNVHDFIETPTIQWSFKTHSQIFASPVINHDLVFIGNLDSILYAINVDSGKEKWRFHTKGEIRSNVCIDGNRLYLNGGDGTLYKLDKISGELIWKFRTEGEKKYDFADYFHSSPILSNGVVYFGSGNGNFYAVNSETGTLKWSFKSGNIIHTTAAVKGNKIFFGSFDGYVYALDLNKGNLIWKFKTVGHRYFPTGEVQGSPEVFNNLIIIGARDYNVYAIDQEKGYCHWNKAFTKGWALCNNVHDSVLYIGSADERVLIAADPGSGKEFWNIKMEFLVFGNNAYSDSLLYIGTTNGKIHAYRLNSGKKVWSFDTESYQYNHLKYFKPDDSYRDDIYSIIKSNEQFLSVECELGGIFSTPYISKDILIFSSTNGILYCLKK
jgi:eukaryotic-like serine/threonine-protein kinase